jgi:signal transduction histidine kinase
MKQPSEGLPTSSSRSLALFSPTAAAPGPVGISGAAHGYHKASLRRISLAAVAEGGLEFSAGLKSLDFPTDRQLFDTALKAAIELLHADGGLLATLEPTGQRLVVRCLRGTGVLEDTYAALAALGRSPQTFTPSAGTPEESVALELEQTRPLPLLSSHADAALKPGEPADADQNAAPDESAPAGHTMPELPVAPSAGYACGQGLPGYIWKMNQALILSDDQCRALPRDASTPPDLGMAWYIGAPLRVPEPLLSLPSDEPAPVVGVLVVAFRDKHWSPPRRHAEVLQLHADRVALALQAAWLEETRQRQTRFLRLLHDTSLRFSVTLDQEQLFAELHELVLGVVGQTSFTIMLYHPSERQGEENEVEFLYAAEKTNPTKRRVVKEKRMPAWWKKMKDGALVMVTTPEEREEYAEALRAGWMNGQPFESLLILPLLTRTREHIIGAMGVASQEPRSYTHEQVEILEIIAQTAAFAFENADLSVRSSQSLAQARNRKRQVAGLNNAVNTLNASLDVNEILKRLVKQANLLTFAQICTVLFFDKEENVLVVRASNAEAEHLRLWAVPALEEIRFELADEMAAHLSAGEQILLDHLDEEHAPGTLEGELYRRYGAQTLLLVPIVRQESLLGVLAFYTPGQRSTFAPEELALLDVLAGQAAVALHNARLYMDLEQALEQQKELDRLKDDFIVTASHEFRTPLSAIHGYASLLQRHSARLSIEQAKRFSTEITRAAQQLVGMVQTLMDASRLDSRSLSLNLQPVEVRPLAESALALIQPDIQQPIQMDIPAGVWVSADAERLRQVMTNLLTNAGKYSPPTQPIDFVARVERHFTPPDGAVPGKTANQAHISRSAGSPHVSKSASPAPAATGSTPTQTGADQIADAAPAAEGAAEAPPGAYLVVSVVDRGDGIAPEDQKKLFQKFVRLQRSLTTPVRGTGLGLYICRQYLSAMGGSIWVESTPGQGAAFSFALPLASPPADAKTAVVAAS